MMTLLVGCKKVQSKLFVDIQNKQIKDSVTIDKSNLSKDEILSWDCDRAIALLGNTISQDTISMMDIHEFGIELLNFLPVDSNIKIKELTWRIDSVTNLTIWYIAEEERWKPLHYTKWNKDAQF